MTPSNDRPAALHGVRTEWRAGACLGHVYRNPAASVECRVSADGVLVHRRTGELCPDLAVAWPDLERLARAFARWASVADGWASYDERGVPPSPYVVRSYLPPGRDAEPVVLGFNRDEGGRPAFHFASADELRPLPSPRAVGDGVVVVADLWRAEPAAGPPGGERVGERWTVDDRLLLDVRRRTCRLQLGPSRFVFALGEAEVPAELLALRPRAP